MRTRIVSLLASALIALAVSAQTLRPTPTIKTTVQTVLVVYVDSLKTGLPFYQELDIPPGDVTVRVGIYDVVSGKMGAFEFPLTVTQTVASAH